MGDQDKKEDERQKLISKIEDLLREHVSNNPECPGVILTDWLIITASYIPDRESATYYYEISRDNQPFHTTLGLVTNQLERMRMSFFEE